MTLALVATCGLITLIFLMALLSQRSRARTQTPASLKSVQSLRVLIQEQERLLSNLQDLEQDLSIGKLSPEDHHQLRDETLLVLESIYSQIDELESRDPFLSKIASEIKSLKSTIVLAVLFFGSALQAQNLKVSVSSPQGKVPHHPIEVFRFKNGQDLGRLDAKTNASGLAVISLKVIDPELVVAVRSTYDGVTYVSDIFSPAQEPSLDFRVYPATKDPSKVHVNDLRLFFSEVEGGVRVDQDLVIENAGSASFIGSSGSTEVLRLSLPSNIFDLNLGMGFSQDQVDFDKNDIILKSPLYPGITRFSVSYSLEAKRGAGLFNFSSVLPIDQVSMSTNLAGLKVLGLDLIEGPQKLFEDRFIKTFTANLSGTSSLSLKLKGLPWNLRFSQWAPFLFVVILLTFTFTWVQRTQVPEVDLSQSRQKLLDELKWLEASREKKLLSAQDYQLRRLASLEKLALHDLST